MKATFTILSERVFYISVESKDNIAEFPFELELNDIFHLYKNKSLRTTSS